MLSREKQIKGHKQMLSRAQAYADVNSTCAKVQVGSLIVAENFAVIHGCNHGIDRCCRAVGCHRVEKYGDDSKLHRLPSDCVAIHSEIDAICQAAKLGVDLNRAVIFVTRYPCEACARAIVRAGIRKVVYGRKEPISDMTANMLHCAGVAVIHVSDWEYADNNS